MTKTVLFDLGNVIIPFDFKPAYERLAQQCGCKPEEVAARIRATGLVAPFEKGEIEAEPFVLEISAALGLKLSYRLRPAAASFVSECLGTSNTARPWRLRPS